MTEWKLVPPVEAKTQPPPSSKEIQEHSWKGRIGHILRADLTVTRVKIVHLWLLQHAFFVGVAWLEKGIAKRKLVTPFSLVYLQHVWLSSDVISSDSDSHTIQPLDSILPYLEVGSIMSSATEVAASVNEVNNFLCYTRKNNQHPKLLKIHFLEPQLEIDKHSWCAKSAYIIHGGVLRVQIGSLVVFPRRIALRVYWNKKQRKRTLATPVSLLLCLALWLQDDLISSDSATDSAPDSAPDCDADSTDSSSTIARLPHLPAFTVDRNGLPEAVVESIRQMEEEILRFLHFFEQQISISD